MRKIVTSNICPPIPVRDFDWCAWFDDEGEEAGRYGYGQTEADAKQDLLDNYDDESLEYPEWEREASRGDRLYQERMEGVR